MKSNFLLFFLSLTIGLTFSLQGYADPPGSPPYKWPKDRNEMVDGNGFRYFLDAGTNIYEMTANPEADHWYDAIDAMGNVMPAFGAGIGRDPADGKWKILAGDNACPKLALHPKGDQGGSANTFRLNGLALPNGASVHIFLVDSDNQGIPDVNDMDNDNDRIDLLDTVYNGGDRINIKFPIKESDIENCHWLVLEIDDPTQPCGPSSPPGGGGKPIGGGAERDPDDPEGGSSAGSTDGGNDGGTDTGDTSGTGGSDGGDDGIYEYRAEECPLLSEIVVTPSGAKFIEILNRNDFNLELSIYYLSNVNDYWKFVNSATGDRGSAGSGSAFNARFPEGAVIPANSRQIIAIKSTDFESAYGTKPDYELLASDTTIPDMRKPDANGIFGPSAELDQIPDTSDLVDTSSSLILYYWDQFSDLIDDCDIANWGPTDTVRVDKTGASIDGPDANADTSAFKADTATGSQDVISETAHEEGNSYQREDNTEGAETKTGGNGMFGHDETSEDLSNTWSSDKAAAPGGGATTTGGGTTGGSGSGGCALLPGQSGQAILWGAFGLFVLGLLALRREKKV